MYLFHINLFIVVIISFLFCSLFIQKNLGDDPNIVKVSLKLPWGKQLVRRYHKTDLVTCVYAFAQTISIEKQKENIELNGKTFDLFTAYPTMSLHDSLQLTIEQAQLGNSQVILRWNS